MGDRPGGRDAAIDQLEGDEDRVGERVQIEANQDGGVQEAIGGSRVDQRLYRNGRLTRYKEVHHEGEVAGGGKGKRRGGEGESAAQPGSYWLGWEFFD